MIETALTVATTATTVALLAAMAMSRTLAGHSQGDLVRVRAK
ncbi:hypothetical protein [Speluncibacter jeojiensis]|uniref:Uncharacterized protein n=1 Tax=Speluncibacter jeojiensis TaxID=2710754 RepID=A0A9X4RFG5_9ACTN|nr:hypothetical protein [Rhodococcus sp. D2-41]MDG3012951.1 hypothetical protein [Corynebacteriales bacterium D3-21]